MDKAAKKNNFLFLVLWSGGIIGPVSMRTKTTYLEWIF
jgi:hypothetical protein